MRAVFMQNNIQAAIGIAAILVAFPATFALSPAAGDDKNEHQQTHPLLSGSVCRVRDSVDFLDVSEPKQYCSLPEELFFELEDLDRFVCLDACTFTVEAAPKRA